MKYQGLTLNEWHSLVGSTTRYPTKPKLIAKHYELKSVLALRGGPTKARDIKSQGRKNISRMGKLTNIWNGVKYG